MALDKERVALDKETVVIDKERVAIDKGVATDSQQISRVSGQGGGGSRHHRQICCTSSQKNFGAKCPDIPTLTLHLTEWASL